MATAVEDSARFDDQARRVDFAGDDAFGFNFHAPFGENHSVKPSGDDYLIPFDLAFDFGAFAENESLIAENVAFDLRLKPERARKFQRAFKAHGSVKESGPFALVFRQTPVI